MKKVMAGILLAVMLVMSGLIAFGAEEPIFEVESVTAKAGETVDVSISVKNNPGIASIKMKVEYDENLSLNSVVYNSAIGGMSMQPQKLESPVTLNWFNGLADTEGDWVFATLSFTVADDALMGTYPINVTYEAENVYNIAEENIAFEIKNGVVTVECAHTEKKVVSAKSADCFNSGNHQYYTCTCGKVLKADGVTETTVEAETIPARKHDISEATCLTPATCKYGCGYQEGVALGHDWTEKVEDAAHLASEGDCQNYKTYYYDCSHCEKYDVDVVWVSTTKGEHKVADGWTTENGKHYHSCTVTGCDYIKDEAAHVDKDKDNQCDICGYELPEETTEEETTEEKTTEAATEGDVDTPPTGDQGGVITIIIMMISVCIFVYVAGSRRKAR